MNAPVSAASKAENLVDLVASEDAFSLPYAEVLPLQIEGIDALFKDRASKIGLLRNRAETAGISEVTRMSDIVPLLFAHTAYKSYPEPWLMDRNWPRLAKWLDTVSTNKVETVAIGPDANLDEWLTALESAGHFVSCSSGTTGKCAMMNATNADLEFAGESLLHGLRWAGLPTDKDRRLISLGQVASTPRNRLTGAYMVEAISTPSHLPFAPDVPPITIGGITEMVILRKKIADGTAKPSELAYFDEQSGLRAQAIENAIEQATEAVIAARHDKLHIMGLFGPLYQVAERVRARGYTGKDFQENSTFISGGLKRAQLPPNYREIVFDTFNFSPERTIQAYGMQELNTNAWRCSAGRYHMAPWVMLLLLDETGDHLVEPPATGEIEGRAAFFDMSLEGRWGGVITGDKVRATWETCACGQGSPSMHQDIQRYADMASGDKIACAGTIDAYVRGID